MKHPIPIGIGIEALLLLLAWGVEQVGSVGVRRVKPPTARVDLEVGGPWLPGVLASVHWNVPAGKAGGQVLFELRPAQATVIVGAGVWSSGAASIFVPCTIAAEEIGLAMVDATTEEILATTQVEVLPAGPDCVR